METYLPVTVLQGCRLFKDCPNLPAGHVVAGCLSSVETYLLVTVLQRCRLLKWCRNLPAWHCVAEVQAVQAVLEPTCWAHCCRCEVCSSGFGTYLPGTVLQGCRLLKRCLNLPARHFVAGVQAVQAVSKHTYQALYCRGAVC